MEKKVSELIMDINNDGLKAREEGKEQVTNNFKKLIGKEYNDIDELQEDADCAFDYRLQESNNDRDYDVEFSIIKSIPFSSAKKIDAYDNFVSVSIEFVQDGNVIRVTDIY